MVIAALLAAWRRAGLESRLSFLEQLQSLFNTGVVWVGMWVGMWVVFFI